MTEQKAGLDRELWARIGEIADAYSKKEMAAMSAAYHAWAADRARIEALEKENRALRANVSKSVLRRLEGQGVLRGEEER